MNQQFPDTALHARPRALLIGASSGIGAALARKLAKEGYQLALLSRNSSALEALCQEINQRAGETRARFYRHDVLESDQIPALFQTILRDMGHLDMVAYVAGVMPSVGLDEYNFDKEKQMVEVNLLGAMAWLGQAAHLFQTLHAGQIVGVSSIAGERGRIKNPAYHASKAGLSTYLESLRNRLSRHGVHVLTVKPGFVDTPLIAGMEGLFWLISPEQAAEDIFHAMQHGKQSLYTPARWKLVALVLHHLPSFIFRRMSF